ncbi:MAG: hypothetical protein ABIZ04_05860 [Opitutus sp.]
MDAKRAAPLSLVGLLITLSFAVVAAGVTWPAWDMFGPTKRPMLQGWDDSFYYFWLPSVIIDHDVDFTNQLAHSGTVDPGTRDIALSLSRTKTGLLESKYPPGWAIGSLPFFLVAHAFSSPGATGFEPGYLLSVWLGQLLYALIGLWLAVRIVSRYFAPNIATVAVLVGWLTSSLVYYQTARLSMSHSQVFTLAMAVFWLALRIGDGEAKARLWFGLGFFAALLVVTRNVALVYLALPAWVIVRKLLSPASAVWLVLGAAAPAAVQLIAWKMLYGAWIAYSYGGERFDFSNYHLVDVLFSARHGWFQWHPLTLPAILVFSVWAWQRTEGRAWLVSLISIVLLSAAWPTWWMGSSFGYRGFEVPTLFVMIGLAILLDLTRQSRISRAALWIVCSVAIAWNLALLALFLTQRIPREEAVTYTQSVHALERWLTE